MFLSGHTLLQGFMISVARELQTRLPTPQYWPVKYVQRAYFAHATRALAIELCPAKNKALSFFQDGALIEQRNVHYVRSRGIDSAHGESF